MLRKHKVRHYALLSNSLLFQLSQAHINSKHLKSMFTLNDSFITTEHVNV